MTETVLKQPRPINSSAIKGVVVSLRTKSRPDGTGEAAEFRFLLSFRRQRQFRGLGGLFAKLYPYGYLFYFRADLDSFSFVACAQKKDFFHLS